MTKGTLHHLARLRILIGAAAIALTACCTPPVSRTLAVTLSPQQTSMWCWAASGKMTMDFLGASVSQCDEANKRFGRSDCCNSPTPSACVNGGWPEYGKYGFTANTTSDAALAFGAVKNQIWCQNKPFAYSWHWDGGGGHMMVARGYTTVQGIDYVLIDNPWPPNVGDATMLTYDAYVSGSGYTHWNDYYDITRK